MAFALSMHTTTMMFGRPEQYSQGAYCFPQLCLVRATVEFIIGPFDNKAINMTVSWFNGQMKFKDSSQQPNWDEKEASMSRKRKPCRPFLRNPVSSYPPPPGTALAPHPGCFRAIQARTSLDILSAAPQCPCHMLENTILEGHLVLLNPPSTWLTDFPNLGCRAEQSSPCDRKLTVRVVRRWSLKVNQARGCSCWRQGPGMFPPSAPSSLLPCG